MLSYSQSAMGLKEMHNWKNTDLTVNFFGNTYNEVWGVVNKGREYAVLGSTFGTHFIDVTDSASFKEVGSVAGIYQGIGVIHRDYKDYNGYLYAVCDEGRQESTLQIIDCSFLPDSVHVVYDTNALITTSHNIFIDTASARLYACGSFGLKVFSLKDPERPKFLYHYTATIVHDIYVRNDIAYLNCETSMRIVNSKILLIQLIFIHLMIIQVKAITTMAG